MTQTKADDLFEAIRLFIAAEIRRAMDVADVPGRVDALVPALIKAAVETAVAELPTPKDGKDADPEAIKAAVETAVAALPKPEKGEDGKDADAAAIATEVLDRVKQGLPVVKDGEAGKSVTVDDVRPILEGEISKSILEIERRAADAVQHAIERLPTPTNGKDGEAGKDGENGRDGKDGLSLETFDFQAIDGGRILRFEAKGGDVLVAREAKTAMPVDRGLYQSGKAYEEGDVCTYGGGMWIAKQDTSDSPSGELKHWRLLVKRGRDAPSRSFHREAKDEE